MSKTESAARSRVLTEEEVQHVLRRAAELDVSRSVAITGEDLEGIAAEVGISSQAICRALEELPAPGSRSPCSAQ